MESSGECQQAKKFTVIMMEGGMVHLLSQELGLAIIPCKFMPFKAMRVGECVTIAFQPRTDKLKNDMREFQKHILNTI